MWCSRIADRAKSRRPLPILLGLTLALGLAALVGPGPAGAHGVSLTRSADPACVLRAMYSDGQPMDYAEAVVFAPGKGKIAFLRTRTDGRGMVAFCPDRAGLWRVEVSDGMGHQAVAEIKADGPGASTQASVKAGQEGTGSLPMWLKLLVGLCLIFGLAGIIALFGRRSRSKA